LIIEDDISDRKNLSRIFSTEFQTVFPSTEKEIKEFKISDAQKLIADSKEQYQIVVLDLLFRDSEGFWLPFNGLDLYKLVRRHNPYASIRIITSLPRDIVAKIAGQLLKKEIRFDQVFTKTHGWAGFEYIIKDRVLEMNNECEEKEKERKMFKPIPTEGVFKWGGVGSWIFELMKERKDEFNIKCQQAKDFFQLYKNGSLTISTNNWNSGKLFKTDYESKITEQFFLQKLPIILTHRLFVIDYALNNDYYSIDGANYVQEVLNKVCNFKTFSKNYLHTYLGFNVKPYRKNDVNGFAIELRNLFPHEYSFISDKKNSKAESEILKIKQPLLFNWFQSILMDNTTYQNWGALNLLFNPYNEETVDAKEDISVSDITIELTTAHLNQLLQSLIDNFSSRQAAKIFDVALAKHDNTIGSKPLKISMDLQLRINHLFEMDI
jgi:hypothetical protein